MHMFGRSGGRTLGEKKQRFTQKMAIKTAVHVGLLCKTKITELRKLLRPELVSLVIVSSHPTIMYKMISNWSAAVCIFLCINSNQNSLSGWWNGADLHAATREVVHHPDAVVPCIVVAVITISSVMAHTQLPHNNTVPQITVWCSANIWHSSDGTWLHFIAVMSSIRRTRTQIFF